MRRFLIDPDDLDAGRARLSGDQARHATSVLRLGVGDRVVVLDGQGREWEARLAFAAPDRVDLDALTPRTPLPESPLNLTLGLVVLRPEKMDLVVQKSTELGLRRLVPLRSVHGAVRLDKKQAEQKTARWRRISLEALKQCGRARPVEIEPVTGLADFLAASSRTALKLLLDPDRSGASTLDLKARLRPALPGPAVWALIGPEGGFSTEEVDLARKAGFETVSLGPRVLRAETAVLTLLAVLGYEKGDLSGFY
jgi:16S rRNA (uracil1498-N3)-methyltransferase